MLLTTGIRIYHSKYPGKKIPWPENPSSSIRWPNIPVTQASLMKWSKIKDRFDATIDEGCFDLISSSK